MKKKTMWVSEFQKYGKFWRISLEHFIKHKLHISEECLMDSFAKQPLAPINCCTFLFLAHCVPCPVFMNIDKDPTFDAKFQHFELFFYTCIKKVDIVHNGFVLG